ncbi:hypothetical protein QBZ16_003609 [Prototheca wickerhamii]|uniref:HMA domain-containing protein n=1 Tax=Prototheca wickerhamii TaxID=3111 RepID=A0AAD9IHV6_PROWI|nr:hypothetical protein QBZ16_003609 [Prototheca wickerhamii]
MSTRSALPGVIHASVALMAGRAEVTYRPAFLRASAIVGAVNDAGFVAELVSDVVVASGPASELLTIEIEGMTCGACSSAVEAALRALPGVESAEVSVTLARALVALGRGASAAQALAAIEDCGFGARLAQASGDRGRAPGGARHDVRGVQRRGAPAALGAALGTGTAAQRAEAARWRDAFARAAALTLPVFAVAMVFRHVSCMAWLYSSRVGGFPLDQLVKWVFATPVQFVCGARFHAGALRALRRRRANMDVLVSLGTNASYLYSVLSILHHHLARHHAVDGAYVATDFFETAAMLITLVLFGKYLEAGAKAQTGAALAALAALAPSTALLVVSEGGNDADARDQASALSGKIDSPDTPPTTCADQTVEIDAAMVHRGDVLKVLPGARLPADGTVVDGASLVDESMLTGESVPAAKAVGDTVIGGTVNVGAGVLRVRAQRVGAESALAQIVQLVESAQLSKAPIQAFADRISAVFVPIVLVLSLLTFAGWYAAGQLGYYPPAWLPVGHTVFLFALLFGIAVLVIACPCALGLATPTAVMVGTGVGARLGILIKGGDALERAAGVSTVVFDKTGTLTLGKPHAVDFRVFVPGVAPLDAALLAAALEQESEHPLASAVVGFAATLVGRGFEGAGGVPAVGDAAKQGAAKRASPGGAAPALASLLPRPEGFEALAGEGVLGRVPLLRGAPADAAPWVELGAGLGVVLFVNPAALAALDGHDGPWLAPVRASIGSPRFLQQRGVAVPPEAAAYLEEMQGRGCTCVLIAVGATLLAALAVQDPLKPEARGVVAALHSAGVSCVLLTGDNWRTARAIAGQLGIRRVTAEVLPAGKAADFVLVRSDLEDVLTAVDLSRAVLRRIRWNYIFALGYNVLAIPAAAGALYPLARVQLPPWVAGACMALSSVSVVFSSLMLRNYRPRDRVLRDVLVIQS